MAELSAAGYAANTLCAKRVALDQFMRWRHRRRRPCLDLTESEICDFLANSLPGDRSRRSVASRPLFGFLDYLRGCQVVTTCAPQRPKVGSPLEVRYADFLRNEKGLAELSLKVYLPVALSAAGSSRTDDATSLPAHHRLQIAAHLFRHTLASRMLHRGAHLREISQVLRHRALASTEIYAKIDLGALQEVVRPWPAKGGAR